jgi:hypothetical protein
MSASSRIVGIVIACSSLVACGGAQPVGAQDLEPAPADMANTCDELDPSAAPPVEVSVADGAPPAGTGGTVEDGIYFLTQDVEYGPDAVAGSTQGVLVVHGQELVAAFTYGPSERIAFTTSGTTMTMTSSTDCPPHEAKTASSGYTASPTELRISSLSGVEPGAMLVFSKQQ